MSLKKRLWLILGPAVIAIVALLLFLVTPYKLKVNQEVLPGAAISQSANIFKGNAIKQAALSENYVAFMGSSELSRMDPFHPVVLAAKYKRPYRPFLLGAAGSQSLSHFFAMQGINSEISHKKVVFVISPQWFTKQGIDKNAFSYYYSNLQAVTWLQTAKPTVMNRYAAKRLLMMPSVHSDERIAHAVDTIAQGQALSKGQLTYVKLKYNELSREDELFSSLHMNLRTQKLAKAAKQLPAEYSVEHLDKLAMEIGEKKTGNNPFRISDRFWNKRLKDNYRQLKGKQAKFNYLASPEYGDFELVLNQFALDKTDVLFVIPPVNRQWSQYTGLSLKMLAQFDNKIKYQLQSQGFNNIVDLSKDGGEKYFMQDTIHLGWRGWLKLDQAVKPFLTKKQPAPNYRINDYFYSPKWQNLQGDY